MRGGGVGERGTGGDGWEIVGIGRNGGEGETWDESTGRVCRYMGEVGRARGRARKAGSTRARGTGEVRGSRGGSGQGGGGMWEDERDEGWGSCERGTGGTEEW